MAANDPQICSPFNKGKQVDLHFVSLNMFVPHQYNHSNCNSIRCRTTTQSFIGGVACWSDSLFGHSQLMLGCDIRDTLP